MGSAIAKITINEVKQLAKTLLVLALIVPIENPNHIVHDKPLLDTYDFIVVGSGAGGAVVASRLSEELHSSVLLLEAGGAGTAYTEWPILTTLIYNNKKYDWKFENVRDEGYCIGYKKQTCTLNRGKMLGGSTAINGMMYVRGNQNDYDEWERLGNPGWGYRDVLPYFIRSEDNQDPYLRQSPYHGVGGYLPVSSARYLSNLATLWIQAARYLGFEIGDINGDRQIRFMNSQSTAKLGERWSTSRAFLRPASHRHNLNIFVNSHVTRVIIDPVSRRAQGVVFFKHKRRHVVWARKEVILSAGAFMSPQLLKLSGVGPCAELRKFGIPCIHNLPGVGENMQSHFGLGGVDFLTKQKPGLTIKHFVNLKSIESYIKHRTGPLSSYLLLEGTGFANSGVDNVSVSQDWPDLQLLFYPLTLATDGGIIFRSILGLSEKLWNTRFRPAKFKPGYRIVPINLHPRSRGRVMLRSRNPFQHPDIFLNLFDDPHDLAVLRAGGRLAEKLGTAPPFQRIGTQLQPAPNPYCYRHPHGGPDWWDCRIRVFAETLWHETSTCAMGPPTDSAAVVDNQLRVYGITGLRVVDASVMPRITSGNTMTPTIMIGEKASDLIKAYWHAVHQGVDPARYVEQHALHPHRSGLYDSTLSTHHVDAELAVEHPLGGEVFTFGQQEALEAGLKELGLSDSVEGSEGRDDAAQDAAELGHLDGELGDGVVSQFERLVEAEDGGSAAAAGELGDLGAVLDHIQIRLEEEKRGKVEDLATASGQIGLRDAAGLPPGSAPVFQVDHAVGERHLENAQEQHVTMSDIRHENVTCVKHGNATDVQFERTTQKRHDNVTDSEH